MRLSAHMNKWPVTKKASGLFWVGGPMMPSQFCFFQLLFCIPYAKTTLWTQDGNMPTIPGATCMLLHVLANNKRVASEGSQNPPDQIFSNIIVLTVTHTKQWTNRHGQWMGIALLGLSLSHMLCLPQRIWTAWGGGGYPKENYGSLQKAEESVLEKQTQCLPHWPLRIHLTALSLSLLIYKLR